ncbi:MAG: ExeM/NucH family extracellular endonuclease [Pseudomonadota bacterium]
MAAFINEIHYDNNGTDIGEFIEIAGTAGLDLTGWSVVLYNGSSSVLAPYNTIDLSVTLPSDTAGFGFYVIDFPTNGIQNGPPDGIALFDDAGDLVEALAYEGSFTANDGTVFADIGVEESASTPVGFSLQRVGIGDSADDFSWASEQAETKGTVNTGQTLLGTALPGISITQSDGSTDVAEGGAADSFTIALDTAPANDVTITLTPDAEIALSQTEVTIAAGTTGPVTIDVTAVADAVDEDPDLHSGTISFALTSDDGDYDGLTVPDLTVAVSDDQFTGTLISEIQGEADQNAMDGAVVTIEAVVVGDFQDGDADDSRNLQGFYLQEEDSDADGNARTSEGIFIFESGSFITDVQVGDIVRVTGTVDEFFGETQIDSVQSVEIVGSTTDLPSAAELTLADITDTSFSQGGDFQPDLEAYEGMLVSFPEELIVTEMFQLDRFNEIKLVEGQRPDQFTQNNAPDAAGYQAYLEEIGGLRITYDDGLNVQNASIDNLDGFAPFETASAVSMGDTITGLSGVLDYKWAGNGASGATWRVRATEDGENEFTDSNPADPTIEDVGGDLQIASFNVLNFFTTLDTSGASTAIGLDPRGADNSEEFDRQLEKLIAAIEEIDADILGLVELENDFLPGADGNAIEFLVDAVNAELGAPVYDWVDPGSQFVGTDAISVGMIYKVDSVTVEETDFLVFEESSADTTFALADVLNQVASSDDQVGDFQRNRPALAVEFADGSGESFTVAVNHFKSKGDSNLEDVVGDAQAHVDGGGTLITQADIDALIADANYDRGDGQAFWNQARADAAQELADFLNADPFNTTSGATFVLGDLNAYAQEDPVAVLEAAGYVDTASELIGEEAYSFVFDGFTGTLDYAMVNEEFFSLIDGVTEWHVNADEADALDYNLDFGRDPTYFDGDSPLRNSDHDPVVLGFNLDGDVTVYGFQNGAFFKDEYANLGRAVGDATDYDVVKVTDGPGIGDFGTVGVAANGLYILAGGDVSGSLVLDEDAEKITLIGNADIDVAGNAENNWILGNTGENILSGGEGRDRVLGWFGEDILSGGANRDALIGGGQADIFAILEGADREVIFDFSFAQGDRIALGDLGFTEFAQIEDSIHDRRGGAVIDLGDEVVKLLGVKARWLDADDFIFDPLFTA